MVFVGHIGSKLDEHFGLHHNPDYSAPECCHLGTTDSDGIAYRFLSVIDLQFVYLLS